MKYTLENVPITNTIKRLMPDATEREQRDAQNLLLQYIRLVERSCLKNRSQSSNETVLTKINDTE
jgi:hypothetical protein